MALHKNDKNKKGKKIAWIMSVLAAIQTVRIVASILVLVLFVGGIASVYNIAFMTKPEEQVEEDEDILPDMYCTCGDCTQGVEINPDYIGNNGGSSSGGSNNSSGENSSGETTSLTGPTGFKSIINGTSDGIWTYLKKAGWNDYAIAGIMGNIMNECSMNHAQKTNKDVGIVQWTDNSSTKRRTSYLNWAETHGGWDNLNTQLRYLFEEGEYYRKIVITMGYTAWPKLDDATDYFIDHYEQYGGYRTNTRERAERRECAQLYYDYYTKSNLANTQMDSQLMAELGVSAGNTTPITGGENGNSSGTGGGTSGGSGSGSGVRTDVELHYSAENVDIDNWDGRVPKEYVINSCDKIIVKQHLLPDKNSGVNTTINGFVVHYWGNESNGKLMVNNKPMSGDNLYSGWAAGNNKTSASFSLGTDGVLWQFVPLNRYSNASNDNGGTIAVEVANQLAGGQYNEAQYKALVHLTAWICYTYRLDTDFDWNMQPRSKKMYWDRGNVRRHYDNTKAGNFRGKTCPAYWTPADGTSETPKYETAGGNLRWIAFKEDVTSFIIKYKDDPNFPLTLEDGSELAGYTESLSLVDTSHVPNWSNGKITSDNTGNGDTSNLRGVGCHCSIPCPYCHCHDNVSGGGNNNGGNGNNSSGGYINSDGVAIDPSLPHVNNGGEGKYWSIDEAGKLHFIGDTWQSTYFLVQARQVMQKYIASGAGYIYGGNRDLTSVGLWPGCRMDCSGFRNAVLKYLGYKPELVGDSSSNLAANLGFVRNDTYENMKPGDLVHEKGHTEIFVGWVDQPGGDWYVYSWGGQADRVAYGNFCEPKIRRKADKTWICSYSPTELAVGKDTSGGNNSNSGGDSGNNTPASEEIEWTSSTNSNFYISTITDSIFNRIQKSYNNCTFRDELRYLHMQYYGFDGQVHTGEMIVNKAIAKDVLEIFEELLNNKYEIERMELMDKYYTSSDGVEADDNAMRANNTSAFNFRQMTTSSKLSLHARGLAVDINTLYNPYVKGDIVKPVEGKEYADRTKNFEHKIDKNDLAYKLFIKKGFSWGGDWNSSKDYQHFEKDIK